jgi:hypothetical protein
MVRPLLLSNARTVVSEKTAATNGLPYAPLFAPIPVHAAYAQLQRFACVVAIPSQKTLGDAFWVLTVALPLSLNPPPAVPTTVAFARRAIGR